MEPKEPVDSCWHPSIPRLDFISEYMYLREGSPSVCSGSRNLKLGSRLALYLSASCKSRRCAVQSSEDFSSTLVGRAGSSGARSVILVIREGKGEYCDFGRAPLAVSS